MSDYIERTQWFGENRLYLILGEDNPLTQQDIMNVKTKLVGSSVRSYSKILGVLLSFIGLASNVTIDNKSFYINNNSLCKLAIRFEELRCQEDESSVKFRDVAHKMDNIYTYYIKKGYNNQHIDRLKEKLKEDVKNGSNDAHDLFNVLTANIRAHR